MIALELPILLRDPTRETHKEDSDHSRGNFPKSMMTEHLLFGQTHWLHLRRYSFQEKHGRFVSNASVKSQVLLSTLEASYLVAYWALYGIDELIGNEAGFSLTFVCC